MVGSSYVVISRHLGTDVARASIEDEVARRLADSGYDVLVTPHLYHLPHESDLWSRVAEIDGPVAVLGWLAPRALECLVREYAGLEPALSIDLAAAEDPVAEIAAALGPGGKPSEPRELHEAVSRRWYPLLDRCRCTSCRHCLQFCLFGVWDTDGREVVAVSPDNCKDGCPACARVCPHGAIIFPLSDEPAVAGAPGTIMRPDAAARRMYYVRTGRRCPVCGEVAHAGELADAPAGGATCEECGRPLAGPASAETSVIHQEIDELIDALDEIAGGGGAK